MTTLTINGAPAAVVPTKITAPMIHSRDRLGIAPVADCWDAMLSASDPALTAAVVEMRGRWQGLSRLRTDRAWPQPAGAMQWSVLAPPSRVWRSAEAERDALVGAAVRLCRGARSTNGAFARKSDVEALEAALPPGLGQSEG